MVIAIVGVGLAAIVLGVGGRLLLPAPRRAGILLAACAGLAGGELGVLAVWAAHGRVDYAWIAGIVVAAAAVAATCAWIAWRNRPYPPHTATPRQIDPEDVRRSR
ncbi:hypothetical protein [Actinocatenispora rupis]|uniref:Uncharacterized protein n=1 Tax=Actinocatenispora rupis TaxID=519421 RepID=A0A8J3J967_9ACTN|nr:hypothetical protein [Actinocatenispora rupis]GID12447.1 hypothetical protein Aru02nite_33360 [Actinocatenispora rupis]